MQLLKLTVFKKKFQLVLVFFTLIELSSCVVNNNLYLNDPSPAGKESPRVFAGIGTGISPFSETFSKVKGISDTMVILPILSCNYQRSIAPKSDIRFSFHLPLSFNGFGLRLGIQQSFLKAESPFNLALGADAGFVVGSRSIQIRGVSIGDEKALGSYNGDLFMPISYRFKNDLKLVLTPRYGYCVFKFSNTDRFSQQIITLGIFKNSFYFEGSILQIDKLYYPQVGIAYNLNDF